MRNLLSLILIFLISYTLKAEVKLKAQTSEEKDLGCITLLKLASEKSKNAGEMIKYEKLKKLQKSFQNKYKVGYFSEENVQSKIDEHNLKIKDKGQRYINKNLQKCGLKQITYFFKNINIKLTIMLTKIHVTMGK